MKAPKKLVSGYGIIDITRGKDKLCKYIKAGNRLRVVITADIDTPLHDDGEGQEFEMVVQEIEVRL